MTAYILLVCSARIRRYPSETHQHLLQRIVVTSSVRTNDIACLTAQRFRRNASICGKPHNLRTDISKMAKSPWKIVLFGNYVFGRKCEFGLLGDVGVR